MCVIQQQQQRATIFSNKKKMDRSIPFDLFHDVDDSGGGGWMDGLLMVVVVVMTI